jgi:hypothetical protein
MNQTILISLAFFIFSDSMNDITIQANLGIRKKKLTGMWIIILKVPFHYVHRCTAGNVMEILNFKIFYWKSVIQFQCSVLDFSPLPNNFLT